MLLSFASCGKKDTPKDTNATDGVKISDRIKPAEEDKIIIKHYPNSFLETDLNEYLKSIGVEELIICGMMTHMCVDTTVRAAMDGVFATII